MRKTRIFILVLNLAIFMGYGFSVRADQTQIFNFSTLLLFHLFSLLLVLLTLKPRPVLISLLGLVFSLFMVEMYLVLRKGPPPVAYQWDPEPAVEHEQLTYWLKPDLTGRVTKTVGEQIIYKDLPFHTDSYGRRSCPDSQPLSRKHALFFGGSFTFGDGVSDEDTLPCAFQSLSRGGFTAYNFGQNGYGSGQMYWLLKSGEFFDPEIPQNGIAVYDFISDHVDRTIGEFSKLTMVDSSYFYNTLFSIDPITHELSAYKIYDRSEGSRYQALRLLSAFSPGIRFVLSGVYHPLLPPEEGVQVVARVIIEASSYYHDRYQGDFYVILWPRQKLEPGLQRVLVSSLESAGIIVLDVPEMPEGQLDQVHPLDPHPSAAEYQWVAEHLLEAIPSPDK